MEKDITILQDSKIAMQIVNKALKQEKSLIFLYIDNRQAAVDGRCVTCDDIKQLPKPNEDNYIFPNIYPQELGKIPSFLRNELEHIIMKFPEPLLGHVVKALFEIANDHGDNGEQKGKFLGIGKGKMNYWLKKLNIGGTEDD